VLYHDGRGRERLLRRLGFDAAAALHRHEIFLLVLLHRQERHHGRFCRLPVGVRVRRRLVLERRHGRRRQLSGLLLLLVVVVMMLVVVVVIGFVDLLF
jgi:hypothetical protein